MNSKIFLYAAASFLCAITVFSEADEGVQNSFLTAFVILSTLTFGEILDKKDDQS